MNRRGGEAAMAAGEEGRKMVSGGTWGRHGSGGRRDEKEKMDKLVVDSAVHVHVTGCHANETCIRGCHISKTGVVLVSGGKGNGIDS